MQCQYSLEFIFVALLTFNIIKIQLERMILIINNIKTGSGNRLKEIRKTLDLSQKELASILNISVGHMCDLEHSRKNITVN